MLQLSEFLPPRPEASWKLIRQAGVDNVVGVLNGAEQDQRMFASVGSAGWAADADRTEVPWGLAALTHNKEIYEKWGFTLIATEDTAPMDKIRLGLDGRDEQIEQFIEQIRALGSLGVPRIMSSVGNFRRMLELVPSDYNGITFCQGNFALMQEIVDKTTSIPEVIREFGTAKIPFVHFRDVKGDVTEFRETFHDAGQTDMPECLRAYNEIGFEGAMRPDHVPTLEGESNDRPGYEMLGRLFAIGYIRGLEQAAYGHPAKR